MVPAVAVLLGVTACGDDDAPSADETPAGDEAEDGSSADDDTDDADEQDGESADAGEGGDEVDAVALFRAIADATVEAGSYEFETSMSAAGQDTSVVGAIQVASDISETNMRVTTDAQGFTTTVLIVDGQFYMEMTEEMGFPTDQGSWMTVDPAADDEFSQQMTEAFGDIGSATDLMAQLAENPELLTVTEVGDADVDGVDTTEYHVVVNDIAEFTGVEEGDVEVSELSYTMWVDGDDLPRRVSTEAGGSASIDTTFSNYGADVEVEAPPADEVFDLSEMLNQQNG
jgi:hypothetical protein